MKKETENWLGSAQYDLDTAGHMLAAGRYIYTFFMCHLAIEKCLKARIIEVTGEAPPKSHDLGYLMDLAGVSPDEEMEGFIFELGNISVVTRYPDDFRRAMEDYSQVRARVALERTERAFKWIKDSIGS